MKINKLIFVTLLAICLASLISYSDTVMLFPSHGGGALDLQNNLENNT